MSTARLAVAGIAAIFAASVAATPGIIDDEGWLLKTYKDPVGIPTACAGVTGAGRGVLVGKTYSQAECEKITAMAVLEHALDLRDCIPDGLPTDTHAAFLRFGYNVGTAKFCASTLSRKAKAGDLAGACAELSRWTYAGGKQLPGLVRRRTSERAQCEKGLAT